MECFVFGMFTTVFLALFLFVIWRGVCEILHKFVDKKLQSFDTKWERSCHGARTKYLDQELKFLATRVTLLEEKEST